MKKFIDPEMEIVEVKKLFVLTAVYGEGSDQPVEGEWG